MCVMGLSTRLTSRMFCGNICRNLKQFTQHSSLNAAVSGNLTVTLAVTAVSGRGVHTTAPSCGRAPRDRPWSIWLSGDPMDKTMLVDMTAPRFEFKNNSLLADAPPVVKKLLSMEFGRKKDIWAERKEDLIARVQRHPDDFGSIEAQIAKETAWIRQLQDHMRQSLKDKVNKNRLDELIDHRRKLLKYLRRWDYTRFQWLLEQLDIKYRKSEGGAFQEDDRRGGCAAGGARCGRAPVVKDSRWLAEKEEIVKSIEIDEKQFSIDSSETEYKHIPEELRKSGNTAS
ncbi:PREDICTED: uncharacterized protein LOC106815776 [Priapulus caudatus]|uniref:Small ribosomal subunit protein uS15m n=1 Tax=Priapulus caudatus TaxID=37621 RepID=A0ABM1EU98_PRICU|nr:PREDICTED: uncharacterized protein LOC106815776 [Priapulus caudatus]